MSDWEWNDWEWPKLTEHKLVASFPAMGDGEYQALVADIAAHGLRMPLIVMDGQIIDGRHRWRAVGDLADQGIRIEPHIEWLPPMPDEDVDTLLKTLNLHRRHLTTSQRAAYAVESLVRYEGRRGRPAHNGIGNDDGGAAGAEKECNPAHITGRAADLAGAANAVSGRMVADAKQLAERAPDLFIDVKQGEKTLWDAQRELRDRQWEQTRQSRQEKRCGVESSQESRVAGVVVQAGEWWQVGHHQIYCGGYGDDAFVMRLPRECTALVAPDARDAMPNVPWLHDAAYAPVQAYLCSVSGLFSPQMLSGTGGSLDYRVTLSAHIVSPLDERPRSAVGYNTWLPAVVRTRPGFVLDIRENDSVSVQWQERAGDGDMGAGHRPRAFWEWLLKLLSEPGHPIIVPLMTDAAPLLVCEGGGRRLVGAASAAVCSAAIARWQTEWGGDAVRLSAGTEAAK